MAGLYGLKGVEDKPLIECIDLEGKYLGSLPSKYFKDVELAAIGVGSNMNNVGNASMKKVFENKKAFDDFSLNVL